MAENGIRRHWMIVIGLALGALTLTLGAFSYTHRLEERVAESRLQAEAVDQLGLIRLGLIESIEAIEGLADVIRVDPQISREMFQQYATLIGQRHPAFYAISWAQWIPHSEREPLVEAIRADGYSIEDISMLDAEEKVVPSVERSHYLVTRHTSAPRFTDAVGTDVLSRARRPEAVWHAVASGEASLTRPLYMSRDGEGDDGWVGIVVFVPIFDLPIYMTEEVTPLQRAEAFRGTVSVGVRTQAALDEWLGAGLLPENLHVVVYDVDRNGERQVVFQRGADADLLAQVDDDMIIEQSLEFGGRRWQVLSVPSEAFARDLHWAPLPWVVLSLGLLVSLLLPAVVHLYLRHHAAVQLFADERARTADELERANEGLRHTNDEMEQFVSAVSHDLKNPLLVIDWTCDALQRAAESNDCVAINKSIEQLKRSAKMMKRIIDDLLKHSRARFATFDPEPVDMDILVRTLVEAHAAEAEAAGVRIHVIQPLPRVWGDPGRLAAAVDNLITNALKHGRSEHGVGMITIGSTQSRDEVCFFVRDRGPGVPPEHRETIFQIFNRLTSDEDGTGVGLAIVKRAAEAHRGRVWVDDTPGGGATFWIAIPQNVRRLRHVRKH